MASRSPSVAARRRPLGSSVALAAAFGAGFVAFEGAASAGTTTLGKFVSPEGVADTEIVLENGVTSVVPDDTMYTASALLTAEKITIDGVLSASGIVTKPHMGTGQNGLLMGTTDLPGGGGGFFQPGGAASYVDAGVCSMASAGGGGASFVTAANFASLFLGTTLGGSLGGGAGPGSGGKGGGHITLRAAEIIVDGTIEADGQLFMSSTGHAVGGGSGGVIEIYAYDLKGSGTLSVTGGQGIALKDPSSGRLLYGGSGSGGLIYIEAHSIDPQIKLKLDGGPSLALTGACKGVGGGLTGLLQVKMVDTCIDADNDMAPAKYCSDAGNADCDDSNPQMTPHRKETCDGLDNDCNGTVDDPAVTDVECTQMLDAGAKCAAGMCVRTGEGGGGSGPGADAGPEATLQYVDFDGGCDVGTATKGGLAGLGVVLMAAFARAARSRKRRRA